MLVGRKANSSSIKFRLTVVADGGAYSTFLGSSATDERAVAKNLYRTTFKEVDLADPFFDSLKASYKEFSDWFARKADEPAYVIKKDGEEGLRGFLYVKVENGSVDDVAPPLTEARRLKVGTMKLEAHGTKLGERALKKIFDHALIEKVDEIYVTVFLEHTALVALYEKYGFEKKAEKIGPNGTEEVLVKSMRRHVGDVVQDYPFIHVEDKRFFLLAVYPDYHTDLFPDSKLHNEDVNIIEDVSHTNTIHKIYIAKMALTQLKRGDVVVIYRTTDRPGQARYRSVATSVCVVEESFSRKSFPDAAAFVRYASPRSVFSDDALEDWYRSDDRLFGVKLLYNLALRKRPIREVLLEEVGISEQPRWDLRAISAEQFDGIMEASESDTDILIS